MSNQAKAEFVEEELSEQSIHDYLVAHPDFFERHSTLLSSLNLPHASGGAVSLVERQVAVLRQKDLKLERQLKELIEVARVIEEAMRSGFDADHAVLVLFGDPDAFEDLNAGRFFRAIKRDDPALKPFSTFLGGTSPRCGKIRDSQREFLFRGDADEIGSAALVPLGEGAELGFLAVGSVDSDRFHPGMSLDFLARLGDLVTGSLQRF
jgi:uncharacterized protein YigA (DUF484 family)